MHTTTVAESPIQDKKGEAPRVEDELFRELGCPVCGSGKSSPRYPIDKEYPTAESGIDVSPVPLRVAHCTECAHQFILPVPQGRFLRSFYSSYVWRARSGFYEGRDQEAIPFSFQQRYGRWLMRIRALGGGNSLLDVGTGLGMFLQLAKNNGFTVAAVEPNREAAQLIQERYKIAVSNCLVEELNTPGEYDVITMWDVLEHLPDPREALRRVYEALKPAGLLVIEIPVRDSLAHWLVKAVYRLSIGRIRRPLFLVCGVHHLQYFSEKSIQNFLRNGGFEVLEVHREQTDAQALLRRPGKDLLSLAKASIFNTALHVLFLLGWLVGKQNKVVVFAKKETIPGR